LCTGTTTDTSGRGVVMGNFYLLFDPTKKAAHCLMTYLTEDWGFSNASACCALNQRKMRVRNAKQHRA
jgi:hypothetical protein